MTTHHDGPDDRGPISLTEARRRRRASARGAAGAGDAAADPAPDDIVVYPGDLPRTARDVRDRLAGLAELFERANAPVRVYIDTEGRLAMRTLTEFDVVNLVHGHFRVCQWHVPKDGSDGKFLAVTLPQRVARLYLAMTGDFRLRPLRGITEAPLLSDDGTIITGAT